MQDEVDAGFKFKFRKAKKPQKESPPTVPNNEHSGDLPPIAEVPDPNHAREEPKLFSSSSSDSLNPQSATTHTVAHGNDPLTQEVPTTIHHALSSADFSKTETRDAYLANGAVEGSRSGGARYGQCLTVEDHGRLRGFVEELVGKRLLPHLSEVLRNLNEWVSVHKWCSLCGDSA